ncbi:MAG: ATP-binding protein [Rhodobiaceae bacterium]|nr:ATP-binding protein [Rhodobiaceae bacterium]MCC0051839.1 ATP-binding protein [Rhodobiaceae bacterium]
MAISLSSLKRVSATKPPRILIYGPPGIGKTTLASEFPDAVFLQIEDGTPGDVELTSFGTLATYNDVTDALAALYQEDHSFKTLAIDSVTELQRLIYEETCARGDEYGNAKARIEDFGYGKGYVNALSVAGELMAALNMLRNDRGMSIVLIAHSTVARFDDPESVSYDRYEIALRASDKPNSDLRGLFEREMDAIILLKKPIQVETEQRGMDKNNVRARAKKSSLVMMHTVGAPAFTAKNRYGIPAEVRYDRGSGFTALAPYLPGFNADTTNTNEKEAA